MRNRFIALLAVLCLLVTTAHANTTHYSYNTPTVGGSQNTWGTLLNTIFNAIDANIWSASGGTTIAVNVPSASGSNIVLTNPINSIQNLSFTTTGKNVTLPPMNATSSPVAGGLFAVNNVGSNAFSIVAADGSTSVVATLAGGQSVLLEALTNSTTNGTFQAFGPYLTSVSGSVNFGASVSATNPSTSASNAGLYSTTSSTFGASILGTSIGTWTSTGLNGMAIGATTSAAATFTSATAATLTSPNATLTGGSINGTTLGATTSSTAKVTTLTAATAVVGANTIVPTAGTSGQFLQTNGSGTTSWHSAASYLYYSAAGTNLSASQNMYIGYGCINASAICPVVAAVAGTVKNMQVTFGNTPGTGNTYTARISIGGSLGNETCTISNSANSCSDLTHTDVIAAGAAITINLIASAGASSGNPSASTELDSP